TPYAASAPRHLPPFPTRRSSALPPLSGAFQSLRRCGGMPDTSRPGTCCTHSPSPSRRRAVSLPPQTAPVSMAYTLRAMVRPTVRSEEHTSELQSRENLVCRLLLE